MKKTCLNLWFRTMTIRARCLLMHRTPCSGQPNWCNPLKNSSAKPKQRTNYANWQLKVPSLSSKRCSSSLSAQFALMSWRTSLHAVTVRAWSAAPVWINGWHVIQSVRYVRRSSKKWRSLAKFVTCSTCANSHARTNVERVSHTKIASATLVTAICALNNKSVPSAKQISTRWVMAWPSMWGMTVRGKFCTAMTATLMFIRCTAITNYSSRIKAMSAQRICGV